MDEKSVQNPIKTEKNAFFCNFRSFLSEKNENKVDFEEKEWYNNIIIM